jgi:integrator complex subunit 5
VKNKISEIKLFSGSETDSEQSPTQPVSLDAITTVSLLLVELISPDVMYNGLPWPEEEFCKVFYTHDSISTNYVQSLYVSTLSSA